MTKPFITPEELAACPELANMTEEQIRAALDDQLCRTDYKYLVEKHRWIKDKNGKIRKIRRLKLAQKKILAIIEYCKKHNMPIRIAIGKSRKQGSTSIITCIGYDEMKDRQIDVLVVAHEKKLAAEIIRMFQRYYEHDDRPGKPLPYRGRLNMREMKFDNHDGHITVATAKNIYAGTGETPQILFMTECSKWERGSETKTALLQCIGDGPETMVFEETTFNGQEDCFLPTWRAAYDNSKLTFTENENGKLEVHFEVTNHKEWNHYIPLFISVLDDEDARLPFLDEEDKVRFAGTLDQYEQSLVDNHQAPLEFLNWRRRTLKLKCKNDEDVLNQEYPVTEADAIRASGRPRFSLKKLATMPIEDGQKGTLRYEERWNRKVIWVPDPQAELVRFRAPQPGHNYVVGCDPAEGTSLEEEAHDPSSRLDASAIEVFDLDNGNEEVAMYHGITTPEALATPLLMLCLYYNMAFCVIENNSSGRTTCIKMGETYDNSLLYHEDDWNPEKTRRQRAIGHKTTQSNRDHIISLVSEALNEDDIVYHSIITVNEHKYFIYTAKGRAEAARGHHDDHVMAVAKARAGISMARSIFEMRKRQDKIRTQNTYQRQLGNDTASRSYV